MRKKYFKGEFDVKPVNIAHATSNGIIFFSNHCSQIGTLAYFDENDKIQTKQVFTKICEFEDFINAPPRYTTLCKKQFILAFNLILALIAIAVAYFTLNFNFLIAVLYFSVTISSQFFYLINNILNIKFNTNNKYSIGRLHSAEHMVLNAYSILERAPTLDEIKKFSRFSKKCGSRLLLSKVCLYTIISILMALVPYIEFIPYIILLSVFTILFIIDSKTGILRFLQIFVTTKPTDKELLLAIEGIKQHEITEKQISEDPKSVSENIVKSFSDSLKNFEMIEMTFEQISNE